MTTEKFNKWWNEQIFENIKTREKIKGIELEKRLIKKYNKKYNEITEEEKEEYYNDKSYYVDSKYEEELTLEWM